MRDLVKVGLVQAAIGFALAALLMAIVLVLNLANLRDLVLSSPNGLTSLLLVWVVNGLLFGAVQFALVMLGKPGDDDDDGPRGGHRAREAIPIRVRPGDRR